MVHFNILFSIISLFKDIEEEYENSKSFQKSQKFIKKCLMFVLFCLRSDLFFVIVFCVGKYVDLIHMGFVL